MIRRQSGEPEASAEALRLGLLTAACQIAQSTQLWRLRGKSSGDSRLDALLARDAREVAADIVRRAAEAAPRGGFRGDNT
jgi:hypothetical protein